jgi:hypothetical protein
MKGIVVETMLGVILLIVSIAIIFAILIGPQKFMDMIMQVPAFIIASLVSGILSAVGL